MGIGIKFLHQFYVGNVNLNNPGSNVISVTSQAAGDHDKKNLTTTPLRETWRSATAIGWQEVIIKADYTAQSPDCFAILNHNLSPTAVVQIQGSMTSDFTTPAFTISLLYNKKHMTLLQDVGAGYIYYKFRFLDPANACGFIEVGRILAGRSFTFAYDEDITDDLTVQTADLAYKMPTEGFFRAFNERVKVDTLALKFDKLQTQPGQQNANFLGLKALMDNVGETFPFLTIVDPNDQYFQIVWGQLDRLPQIAYTINRYASLSLSITEVY